MYIYIYIYIHIYTYVLCTYIIIHLTLYSFGNLESFKMANREIKRSNSSYSCSDYLQTESYSRIDTVKFIIFSNT